MPTIKRAALARPIRSGVWLVRKEFFLLLLCGMVVAGIWAFAELADEVIEGSTQDIDRALVLMMRNPQDPADPIGPHWVEEMGRDFTALGGVGLQMVLTAVVIGALAIARKRNAAILVLVAVLGGLAISMGLKEIFERPRPDLVPHGSYVYTSSFPSGHSMMSAVTYLTLGALLSRLVPGRGLKMYFIAVAIALTVAVGVSRVYLGVHWPTDVLAGWSGGFAWAILCWTLTLLLQRRGAVEQEQETSEELRERTEEPAADES